ncbi:MAG: aminotransferase class V-fold PLP-dependent enzyme [Pirellulaceae bacterium]
MLAEQIRDAVHQTLDELVSTEAYRRYTGDYSSALADRLSAEFADARVLLTSSGTAAIEIALRAAGVGQGDVVVLSGFDYPGNFWAIERCGARPLLVDIERDGWNLSMDSLKDVATSGQNVKALVVSHLYGQLQPMLALREWCDHLGWLLVEDSCQSLGASIGEIPVGTVGHFGIASFGGGKVLSAGRGGCLISSTESLMAKAHVAAGAGSGPYGLSELQAAMVLAQLPFLRSINETCTKFFSALNSQLVRLCPVPHPAHSCPSMDPIGKSHSCSQAYYQLGWLASESLAKRLDEFIALLTQYGLAVGRGFPGFHRRSDRRCTRLGELPHTILAAERTWVMHHSQALAGSFSPADVAQIMADAVIECTESS